MPLKPITVTQLNEYLKRVVSSDPLLNNIRVSGEVSGVKYHYTGHVYFSLVDNSSKINCFFHKEKVLDLDYKIEDGMSVILSGGISIFSKNGSYSLYIHDFELEGKGDLAIAFEKMKSKLNEEGLFDPTHKKQIPKFPNTVGVVTALTGAALKDILKIIKQRNNICNIKIFPTPVQGTGAAEKIAKTIDYINKKHSEEVDVIILGRGGGAAEDLWTFNEEILARSIYNSSIPIISGVGHEIDFTISDFVSDLRAETPTAAAQLAVPDVEDLKEKIYSTMSDMYSYLSNTLVYKDLKIENTITNIKHGAEIKIKGYDGELKNLLGILQENNPINIMSKGYSIITDSEGKTLLNSDDIKEETNYLISLYKGKATGKLKRNK